MRISAAIAAVIVMSVGIRPAAAQVLYQYRGLSYTVVGNFIPPCGTGLCADYTRTMQVTGSFMLFSPLPPNSTANLAGSPNLLAWSFSDGINTLTEVNSIAETFTVTTDGSGGILAVGTDIKLADYLTGSEAAGGRGNGIEVGYVAPLPVPPLPPVDAVANNLLVSPEPDLIPELDTNVSIASSPAIGTWLPILQVPSLGPAASAIMAMLLAMAGMARLRRRARR